MVAGTYQPSEEDVHQGIFVTQDDLTVSAQEALRYRVAKAVESGMSKSEEGRVFSISRTAPLHHWTKAAIQGGI